MFRAKPVGQLSVNCWPTVGRLLAVCRPPVGRLSADLRPTVGCLLGDCWPTDSQQSADSRPTVGQQSADSRPTVDRQSANRFFGELFFTITGDSMESKGQFVGLDWNRITRLHSQVMTGTQELWVQSHLGLGFFF